MTVTDGKELMKRDLTLHWSDRFRWWNAYLFILCGAVIVYRTYGTSASWLAMGTGIAFLAFGFYRLRLFRRVMNGELPPAAPRRKRMIRF